MPKGKGDESFPAAPFGRAARLVATGDDPAARFFSARGLPTARIGVVAKEG